MTRLTNQELETIRTRPQQTKLYLSIFQPQVVMKCRVNDAGIAMGQRVITYNTVSVGSYTNIEPNFTMWIGTSDGGQDLGKIRVRSATATEITVSENSDVRWQNGAYLTIFKYVELWPVFPRIINDPSNIENTLWYKDYDIAYTNQNSILGTYIDMGPNRATMLDPASGQAQLWYSSTGSYNLLGASLNYNWTFEGGSPSTSSAADPGYVTYNTPGNYVTRLQISGSNGCIDTAYRYIRIHNPSDPPIQKWQLNNLQGSRDEGGYTASFKVFETIPIQEFAVVVIFADNYYGSTHQSFGGNYPNGSNIFWTGYIDKDSIQYDYQHSEMTFDAVSITQMMKRQAGFSVSVESRANPAFWYELLDMDGRRALYHYLRWHTTALQVADFQFVGNDQKIQYFDSDRESMYDALDNFMRDTLWGKVVSDRQGKVWMEMEAEAYPNPTGSFPTIMEITRRDWKNEPTIDERLTDEVSFIEMGGVAYSGTTTGTYSALLTATPGNAPGFRGSVETHEGLALLGQDQLNTMAGNVFANKNSPYPAVSMEMAGNYSNLDIAPQEGVQLNISASDTVRNVAINGLYIPRSHSWKFIPQDSLLMLQSEFKQVINGVDGETIVIPPPQDVGGGFTVPGLQIPPIPPLAFPPFPSSGGSTTGSACCDYFAGLGIGDNLYCCTVIRYTIVPTPSYDGGIAHWVGYYDYASNPAMYTVATNRINFINTGSFVYDLSIQADFDDHSEGFYVGQLLAAVYTPAGAFTGDAVTINATRGTSGHVSNSARFTFDSDFKSPNGVRTLIPVASGADNPVCNWTNIKVRICRVIT